MNLTPRELRIFVSLASSLNFGQTAEKFFVTQPTTSKMIRTLEDKLGVKLFERSTRSVSLTPEGRELLEVASRVVDEFEMGMTELAEVARRRSQRLSIAALPSLAATLLPDLVTHLRAQNAYSIIKIYDVINDAAMDLLRMRKVDFALSGLEVVHRDLSYTEIMREPFVLLASRAFPIELNDAVWLETDLEKLPVISMPRGTGTRMCIDMAFMKLGLPFRPFLEIQGLSTIGKFVKKGCGVSILPLSAAQLVLEEGLYIIPLGGAPERTIGVITRHESGLSELAIKAIDWIREVAPLRPEVERLQNT
jgi:DNA-binding transcriptional LysR family regulator